MNKDAAVVSGHDAAGKKFPRLKSACKVTLFRMWAAGAVCFFAAWGRGGAETVGNGYSLDLVAGLVAIMILCDIIIVNPVIRLAMGKRVRGEEKSAPLFLLCGLLHIVKVTALMLLVTATYYGLNVFCIRLFGLDEKSVPVPLEPLLFGLLYGLYYLIFETTGKAILGKRKESV